MAGNWAIEVSDIPDDCTVEEFIYRHTDFKKQIQNFRNFPDNYRTAHLDFPIQQLQSDIQNAVKEFGVYPFRYNKVESFFESYLSASLSWNPFSIDSLSQDPHQNTLGSSKYSSGSADLIQAGLKNTYADTLSFNQRTPFSHYKSIGTLLDSFQLPLIRSRISIMTPGHDDIKKTEYMWHRDETVFLNLRINVPVVSGPEYVIQLMSEDPSDPYKVDFQEFALIPGQVYVYNSHKNHRPFAKANATSSRTNMICGVTPWFDFDPIRQVWSSNKYYGVAHPFEIFSEGLITPFFKK